MRALLAALFVATTAALAVGCGGGNGGWLYAVGGCTTDLHDSQVVERIGVRL